MVWNVFRNKNLKALDKIYETYEKLYTDYRKFADVDNELLNRQATIIRGQLHQAGAAFDHVIAASGPEYIDKCIEEYGYIPYTALSHIVKSPKRTSYYEIKEDYGLAPLEELMDKVKATKSKRTRLHKLLNKKYLVKISEELAEEHLEMLEEGLTLKLFDENDLVAFKDSLIVQLKELYYFPKEKATDADREFQTTESKGIYY